MGLLKRIKDLFLPEIKETNNTKPKSKRYSSLLECKSLDKINLGSYPSVNIGSTRPKDNKFRDTTKLDPSLPNLLFVEDYQDMKSAYRIVINNIGKRIGKSLYDQFNICEAYGKYCGGSSLKFLRENKIDYAILDITLGEVLNIPSDEDGDGYVFIDGIDIALEILKVNPDAKIIFLTGHTLNEKYPAFKEYIDKFKNATGKSLIDHYLKKSDVNEEEHLIKFLFGENNGQ